MVINDDKVHPSHKWDWYTAQDCIKCGIYILDNAALLQCKGKV